MNKKNLGRGFLRVHVSAAIAIIFAAISISPQSHGNEQHSKNMDAGTPAENQPKIVGLATVIDGDTIEIHGERIRLFGIDAPESGQLCVGGNGQNYRCGQISALALDALVFGRSVSCDDRGRDRYGRVIGVCRVQGQDIGGAMVRLGFALAYRQYSTIYAPKERDAQRNGVGMWQGNFEAPWIWRRQ